MLWVVPAAWIGIPSTEVCGGAAWAAWFPLQSLVMRPGSAASCPRAMCGCMEEWGCDL